MNMTKLPPSSALGEFIWATFFFGFAALLCNHLDKMERVGGQTRLRSFISIGYNLGGKWGAVIIFILFGGVCCWAGIQKMKKSR